MKYGNFYYWSWSRKVLAIASSKDLNPKVHRAPLRPSKLRALRKAHEVEESCCEETSTCGEYCGSWESPIELRQDKCHQHFKLVSLVSKWRDHVLFYCKQNCMDDVVPLGIQQTLTTSTLSNAVTVPPAEAVMCTQILNSQQLRLDVNASTRVFRYMEKCHQLTRKQDMMIKCLQVTDTTTTYKKVNGSWFQWFHLLPLPCTVWGLVVVLVITLSVVLAFRRRRRLLQAGTSSCRRRFLSCSFTVLWLLITLSNEWVLCKCHWHIYVWYMYLKIRLFIYLNYITLRTSHYRCSTYPFGSFDRSAVNL